MSTKFRITPAIEAARIAKAKRDCPTPILDAEACIRKALEMEPGTIVAWSGGKCSTIVLHLALKQKSDIPIVFNDTGVEFPETYDFVKRLEAEWGLNLVRLKPQTTFWEIVKKYGFPMLRGKYKPNSVSKDGKPMCCQLLKEEPIKRAAIRCSLTGVRASESRMRTFGIAQNGQIYFAKTLGRINAHPICFWTTEEVWAYHRKHGIPFNEIYNMGHDRCGCWPCTGYLGWKEHLAESHPKMYRMLSNMIGEPTLWEYDPDIDNCKQMPVE